MQTLTKVQVNAICLKQDAEKCFTQICRDLYGDATLEPIQMGSSMAAENQQKHLSLNFATKA